MEAGEMREHLNISYDKPMLTFFSQPLSKLYGNAQGKPCRGYDEYDVLKDLLKVVLDTEKEIHLVINLHPKEDSTKYDELLQETKVSYTLAHDEIDFDILILDSDLVIGMSSIALLKAAIANRPLINYQPRLEGEDISPLGRLGISPPVLNQNELSKKVHAFFENKSQLKLQGQLPQIWSDGKATERCLNLIYKKLEIDYAKSC